MAQLSKIRQAVILAGGLGTRLRPLTNDRPKPMVEIHSRPFLDYLINLLKEQGIEEIILLVGYLAEKIIDYCGDGSRFGLTIKYSSGDVNDDTGTRIRQAADLLDDYFLLLYCDNYWPLDLPDLLNFHLQQQSLATVTVYTNKFGASKNNITVDEAGFVSQYDRSRTAEGLNGVEIGFFIVRKDILDLMPSHNFHFESEILPQLIKQRQLAGFQTNHHYYSLGSLDRLPRTEKFLQPKKVIFLDRDGVINERAEKASYITNWAKFKFLPGTIEALKLLTEAGYKIFVISNQAGVARGFVTESDLQTIHSNMVQELQGEGVQIHGIYYCPHGWDDGCYCRKPKPGMLFQAAHDHHLDLTKAILVGDDERDLQAGTAARCKTYLVDPAIGLAQVVDKILAVEN